MPLAKFLEAIDKPLADEYNKERYLEGKPKRSKAVSLEKSYEALISDTSPLKSLRKVSELPISHRARIYLYKRQIPDLSLVYYTDDFNKFANGLIPGKLPSKIVEERIVFPFLTTDGRLFGFQGRVVGNSADKKNKFVTIMLEESQPRIFGLDRVDLNSDVFVVESPIDSFFLPNCIATAGGLLHQELDKIGIDKSRFVVVYDNEPRNPDIIKRVKQAIKGGYRVVVWPDWVKYKDINQAAMDGFDMKRVIDGNVFLGLEAELAIKRHSKV